MRAEARYLEPIQPLEEENSPKPDIFLSVVIPVSTEGDRIDDTLSTVNDYLQTQDFNSEIIIVDDGNYDRTMEIIKSLGRYVYEFKEQRSTRIKMSIKNLGQGFSIARSILRTRGKYILCMDEDLSTPISEVEKLWPHVLSGADIVLTFPKIQTAQIHQPLKEKLMEYAVRAMARLTAINGIRYRQCKFKLLEQESAKSIARAQKLYNGSFEIEQLYLAHALGFSIKEVPVEWHPPKQNKADSQNGDAMNGDNRKAGSQNWDLRNRNLRNWNSRRRSENCQNGNNRHGNSQQERSRNGNRRNENGQNNPMRLLLDILELLYIHRDLKRSTGT
jgi:dolichyl-phosphate beta-glucosyltransferase